MNIRKSLIVAALFMSVSVITFAQTPATKPAKKEKAKKIQSVIPRLNSITVDYFAPTKLIKLDERFVELLTAF